MFSANQNSFVIGTRVTEELHFFLSQSELSNFLVYIINMFIGDNTMKFEEFIQE